jgi:cytochrome c556
MPDSAKDRIYLAVIAGLLLVIAALAYKFNVAGSVEASADNRSAIILEPGERALMLREMREFVVGLQRIDDALSRRDMQGTAKASRALGASRVHEAPAAMTGKLPMDFKARAVSVRNDFDTIAADAEGTGLPESTLGQLSDVLQKCTFCHDSYRLREATLK